MENGKSSAAVQRFEIRKPFTPIYRFFSTATTAERPTSSAQRLLNFPQSVERIHKPLSGWQKSHQTAERPHKPLSELVLETFLFSVCFLAERIHSTAERLAKILPNR